MADVINLTAEEGRNIIGDDSSPTLTLENVSSGNALRLQNAGGTGVLLSAVSCPTTSVYVVSGAGVAAHLRSGVTESIPLVLDHSVCGSATVALLKLSRLSTASGPIFDFGSVSSAVGGVVSTASACATLDYAVRVKVGDAYGWIPVYRAVA